MILDSPIITGSLSSNPGTSLSGSFSGSFEGNGSGLTGITAEWDGTHTGTATFIGNITASGNISGSATSTLSIGGASTLKGANTFGTNGGGTAQTIYGNITHWDNFTTYGVLTANGNTILGNASSDTITLTSKIVSDITASGYTVSASTFIGDGSQLTGIEAGLWSGSAAIPTATGDVQITGSLTISGSFNSFTLESSNIVLGAGAGANMTSAATNNVIIGTNAGDAGVTGDKNVFIGEAAGGGSTSGNYNTYVGYQAGLYKDNEANNVIIGYRAGEANGGSSQVAIGYYTANPNTQNYNIAIGEIASRYSVSGRNVSIGYYAGVAYAGDGNVSMGHYAAGGGNGNDKSAGEHNVAIGDYTLYGDGTNGQDGSGNIALGYSAGKDIKTGNANIIIGSGSLGAAAIANQLRIGHNGNILISGSLTSAGGLKLLGEVSASSYIGDGSGLTGIVSASYALTASHALDSGAAGIFSANGGFQETINNLVISSSNHTASLQVIGSGSTIFDVQGDAGTLFTVSDGLDGELFAANDASGLSIISAHVDRTVKLGKPGGFGIVISGSNPLPSDLAANIIITGSIYHTGSVAQFSGLNVDGAYSFPTTDGDADQILKTNGSGQLSFAAQSGGGGLSTTSAFANSWFMG